MARAVSRTIDVDADPATIFDVLADPAQHSLFDGSGTVRSAVAGPPRLYLGARFSMRMRWVAPYLIRNTVVEYDEDRRIAWRHFGRHVWRYELEPIGAGTRVTETFDAGGAPLGFLYGPTGMTGHNTESIETTLQRLKVLIESRVRAPR